jgi:hypothetical protein
MGSSHLPPVLAQPVLRCRHHQRLAPDVSCRIVQQGEEEYLVTYKDASGAEQQLHCGLVMFATGRAPRSMNIGVEAAGVGGPGGWRPACCCLLAAACLLLPACCCLLAACI